MRLAYWTMAVLAGLSGCSQISDSTSAIADPSQWPSAASPEALSDAQIESEIDALIEKMTLKQKVGQLIQADISAITPADLAEYPIGSLLAGGNSGPYGDERASPADWDRLVQEFRAASTQPVEEGVAIPIIFGVDAVHGHNNIPSATIFPHNIGLGAANDPDLIRRIGAATAAEVAGSGIEWTFAPTLAVPQDPRWGRTYEGYSSDPAIVESYSTAMVMGLQGELVAGERIDAQKVASTAKHFLADGGTTAGKDQGDAAISEAELVDIHARGYPAAINAGALTVMASFSSWHGIKHHGNKSLLTGVLKEKMGFDGFVVGDWNGHGQVAGCTVTSCAQAINAGLDMFMAPDSWKGLFASTLAQAEDGTISIERIDDAVRRILRVKFKLGLFDEDAPVRRDYAAVGAQAHLDIAREAVAKSLVLLKNNGSILPIKPGAKVLVTGPGANSMAMQSGGWTVSWQGSDVTKADFPNGQTIWDAMSEAIGEAGGQAELSEDGAFDNKPDVAVVVFGEPPYAEFQGDIATLDYQPAGAADLAMLKQLKAQGIPVVSVFLSGRPLFASPEINASDAFVAAWLPGTQANGVADVLVAGKDGKSARDFTGRLPFAWPATAASPVVEPLFELGYGLSYAEAKEVGALSEDPGIDMANAMNIDTYFAGGRARDPWFMSVADSGGKRPVASAAVASPAGLLSTSSVDVKAQEDGKKLAWSGDGVVTIDGPTSNLSALLSDGKALQLEWRIDQVGSAPVKLGMSGTMLDITDWISSASPGELAKLDIPLECFADAGASFDRAGNALMLQSGEGLTLTLVAAKVTNNESGARCPA